MTEIHFYSGYEMILVRPRGPILQRARYRLRVPRVIGRGRSQSHIRKLVKQWRAVNGSTPHA